VLCVALSFRLRLFLFPRFCINLYHGDRQMSDIVERPRRIGGGDVPRSVEADCAEAAATIERLRAALTRQGDNMAFVLNRVTLPEQWRDKFERELAEDCAALNEEPRT
jgi:hypothetical protein